MGIKRIAFRVINKTLEGPGFVLQPINVAFKCRTTSEPQLDRMFSAFSERCEPWLRNQTLIEVRRDLDVKAEVRLFYERFLESPYRNPFGGSGFNNLLWIYLITAANAPDIAIDSGTYTGASAWAMRLAAPSAKILSFDIDMSRLANRTPGVDYIERDWTTYDFRSHDMTRSLVYFDDHVDQAKRLLEAHALDIPLCLFDDDFSVFNFPYQAMKGASLPKVEFVTDLALRDEEKVTWVEGDTEFTWIVDSDYLDRALATISAAERPPSTSNISGSQQFPCKVVRMNVRSSLLGQR